ncbi:MAG: helix-turn-helix transcriptional regulator [Xanthomonadales bacterium]|nr:helix-turn-helix transcriptional regulator [Xanthomonadales bacterium]
MNAPIYDFRPDYRRIDSLDGPPLIAYIVKHKPVTGETGWHTHQRGQFMHVESGMVCVRTRYGVWAITAQRIGWMPPEVEHTVRIVEPITGWGVWVAPQATRGLPPKPAMLQGSPLMRELVYRAAAWTNSNQLDTEQQRLLDVLMDEMRHAQVPDNPITLVMPDDRRVLRVAERLLTQPGDTRTREQWAIWAGLSTRSLTRLFREQTGMSFVQWRQQARLSHALEQLGQGAGVAQIADSLGYASASAFVAMFRRCLGQSPGRYLSLDMELP